MRYETMNHHRSSQAGSTVEYHDYLKSSSSESRESLDSARSYHTHLKDIESPKVRLNDQNVRQDDLDAGPDRSDICSAKRQHSNSDEYHEYLKAAESKAVDQVEKNDSLIDEDQTNAAETQCAENVFEHEADSYHGYLRAAKQYIGNDSDYTQAGDSEPPSCNDRSLYLDIIRLIQNQKGVQMSTACDLLGKWNAEYRPVSSLQDTHAQEHTNYKSSLPSQEAKIEGMKCLKDQDRKTAGMDDDKFKEDIDIPERTGTASDIAQNTLGTMAETAFSQASAQGSSQGAFAIGAACVAAFAAISVAVTRLVLIELPLKDVEAQKARDAGLEVRTNVEKLRFEMQDVESKIKAAEKELEADRKALENDRKYLKERALRLEHQQKIFEREKTQWDSYTQGRWREDCQKRQDSHELSLTIATIAAALKNLPGQLSEQRAACPFSSLSVRSDELTAQHWASKIRQNVLDGCDDVGEQVVRLCREFTSVFIEALVKWNHWASYAEKLKSRTASISSVD